MQQPQLNKSKIMKTKNHLNHLNLALIVGSLALASITQAGQHPRYQLIDLGTFGGPSSTVDSVTECVNHHGITVGAAETAGDPSKTETLTEALSPEGFHDDGQVDRSLLDPPLTSSGPDRTITWACQLTPSGPVCKSIGVIWDLDPWEPIAPGEFTCGGVDVRNTFSQTFMSTRYYNNDYKILKRRQFNQVQEVLSLQPDGSGNLVYVDSNYVVESVWGIPADPDTITEIHNGMDARGMAGQGPGPRLFFQMEGRAVYSPDGEAIQHGQWDLTTDPEGVFAGVCAALLP
jgi:hypothetical protein